MNVAGHRAIRITFDRQVKYAPSVGSADGGICTYLPLFADPSSMRNRVIENMKMGEWCGTPKYGNNEYAAFCKSRSLVQRKA